MKVLGMTTEQMKYGRPVLRGALVRRKLIPRIEMDVANMLETHIDSKRLTPLS